MKRLAAFITLVIMTIAAGAGEPRQGYRGFVDIDISYSETITQRDLAQEIYDANQLFIGVSTSHGYQFNPHIYAGVGTMITMSQPAWMFTIPLFADVRYDNTFGKFNAFADLRIGYHDQDEDENGLYLSPTIGYRFNRSGKKGFSIGIGMTVRGMMEEKYTIEPKPGGGFEKVQSHMSRENKMMGTLRLSWDF